MDAAAENLTPAVLASLARQVKQLATAPPDGVTYVPSESIAEVLADISGPTGTPYEGGSFRCKLVLGADYPSAPPKGYFLTKMFHPNVSAAGDICVNTLKKDWKPEHTLAHVLAVIRCLLIEPFPESSLNAEAGKLIMESYDEYARKARLFTTLYAGGKSEAAGAEAAGAVAAAAGGGAAAVAAPSGAAASAAAPETGPLTAAAGKTNVPAAPAPVKKVAAPSAEAATKEAAKKKAALKRL